MGFDTLLSGSTSGSFQLEDVLKKFSITGNIMLDTMIIMNAYTFCKAYIEMLGKFLKDNSLAVLHFVFFYAQTFVKSKVTGKIVFKSAIPESHEL